MRGTSRGIPLSKRESSRVEYKRSKSALSKDVWETVSAFANTAGGTGLRTAVRQLRQEGYSEPEYINDARNDLFTFILKHPHIGIDMKRTVPISDQVTD